jgi:hypothetical protein
VVQPGLIPASWIVDKCTIDGFVTVAEMRPAWLPAPSMRAEPGRIVVNSDVVEAPMSLVLIDAPTLTDVRSDGPTVLIAASSPSAGWTARPISVSSGGQAFSTLTAVRKSVLGQALTALAGAQPYLIDASNSVDVALVDAQQWLTSCDDDALAEGMNLAILGGELVQFGDVTPLGEGRFRLARLLRGRAGTEWVCADHSAGETFCILDNSSVRTMPIPIWARGAAITAAGPSGAAASVTFAAESIPPLQPDNLSAEVDAAGDLALEWTRRSRSGFAWLDEVDAPLGESREEYRVTLIGAAASLAFTSDQPSLIVAGSDLASIGAGAAAIEVHQLGDWAASRPAQINLNLS